MRKLATALVVLVTIGAPAYWWLLLESAAPQSTFALDIAELRRLADSMEGEKPAALRVEHVSGFESPATGVFAGNGWAPGKLPVYSYQLVFRDRTVVVDTAMNEQTAKGEMATYFDAAAFARAQTGLEQASLIVVTHEHFDHLGGISTHPKLEQLAPKLKLAKAQLSDPTRQKPLHLPDAVSSKLQTLDFASGLAIAPGVVLWNAPGHSPGSQLVFVKRADGEEFLFLGDVAWHQANWQHVHERARLVSLFFLREDRDAVLAQLAAIKALSVAEPKLHLIPGHDGVVVDALIQAGLLTATFQLN